MDASTPPTTPLAFNATHAFNPTEPSPTNRSQPLGILVHSPFDGQPVKVRDQDVGRAVRDKQGRIFYVLEKSDGTGHYGAPTRAGGEKDEHRYDQMLAKASRANQVGQAKSYEQIHDATGKRPSPLPKLILAAAAIAAAALAYLYATGQLQLPTN